MFLLASIISGIWKDNPSHTSEFVLRFISLPLTMPVIFPFSVFLYVCHKILNSSFYPAASATDTVKLATNVLKGALDLYTTPYLESGTWAIMDTKSVVKPLIIQMRKDIQFTQLTTGPDAFMRKKLYFGVDARFEVAFGMWQYAYASNSGW